MHKLTSKSQGRSKSVDSSTDILQPLQTGPIRGCDDATGTATYRAPTPAPSSGAPTRRQQRATDVKRCALARVVVETLSPASPGMVSAVIAIHILIISVWGDELSRRTADVAGVPYW